MAGRPPPDRIAYWQAVDSGRLLLVATALTLVTAAFAVTAVQARPSSHPIYWTPALAFGGFIAFGELLRLALPGGRESAPIAMVGAMSYALLLALPKHGAAGIPRGSPRSWSSPSRRSAWPSAPFRTSRPAARLE